MGVPRVYEYWGREPGSSGQGRRNVGGFSAVSFIHGPDG